MLGIPTRQIRILVQFVVFSLWVALVLLTRSPIDHWLTRVIPVSFMLRIDPLVMTAVSGGMRVFITITMLGFVTLGISMLLGRVFCGWVCPLGAIFDGYGWFLNRLGFRAGGPSPSWFRFKFYLLAAILIFAVIGGVSPLMGFDPIVLLTRTAATVINPFLRKSDDFLWTAGGLPGRYGLFVDFLTLTLFIVIMGGTTKVSRIWCRTTCPLGAYLAVASRNSVLRRDTEGCIHCNICAIECPTGAISFTNPEVYNESECIKCFTCSQACPVDANFFTLKSPLPAASGTQQPVSLDRRQLLVTAATTLAAAPVLRLSAGESRSSKSLIRPPMSKEEGDFLTSCIRCGECMKACPTGILKPSGIENGLRALWSPVMVASEGECQKGCNACSVACPTDAIMKYAVEDKYKYKAGTAVFNSALCISYSENKFCSECVRACPTNAIEFSEGWKPEGAEAGQGSEAVAPLGQLPSRPLRIKFESCVGCGACETSCNQIVFGAPAMVNTSYGRAVPTQIETGKSS